MFQATRHDLSLFICQTSPTSASPPRSLHHPPRLLVAELIEHAIGDGASKVFLSLCRAGGLNDGSGSWNISGVMTIDGEDGIDADKTEVPKAWTSLWLCQTIAIENGHLESSWGFPKAAQRRVPRPCRFLVLGTAWGEKHCSSGERGAGVYCNYSMLRLYRNQREYII